MNPTRFDLCYWVDPEARSGESYTEEVAPEEFHQIAIGEGYIKLDTLDLVSQPEIAERLGVTTNTVHVWRQRHKTFPVPEWVLGQVPIWRWEIIEKWAFDTGRLDKETF